MPESKDWIILVAGVLLGIPATLFVNWLQRTKGRLLAFETRGQNVLTKHGANFVQGPIALTSGGQQIPRLSIAAVTIWNAGDAEIDGAAIATSDPLHIELRGEGEIVQAYVERNPFPGCQLRLLCERNRATVAFDYLNPGQGAVIRILHTAEDPVVDLCGSLMGIQLVHAERLIVNADLNLTHFRFRSPK